MEAELATLREQHKGSRAALESAHVVIATDKQKREHLQSDMAALASESSQTESELSRRLREKEEELAAVRAKAASDIQQLHVRIETDLSHSAQLANDHESSLERLGSSLQEAQIDRKEAELGKDRLRSELQHTEADFRRTSSENILLRQEIDDLRATLAKVRNGRVNRLSRATQPLTMT